MSTSNDLPSIYAEKENIQEHPEIPNINKVTADDMNVIKGLLENSAYIDNDNMIDINGTIFNPIIPRYEGKVLWQNPNPSSVIASEMNISLSNDDYDVIEVFYKTANDGNDLASAKTIKGQNINLSSIGYQGAGLRRRLIYNTDTSYTISTYNGATLSDSATGKYIIPIYIIGYKTG